MVTSTKARGINVVYVDESTVSRRTSSPSPPPSHPPEIELDVEVSDKEKELEALFALIMDKKITPTELAERAKEVQQRYERLEEAAERKRIEETPEAYLQIGRILNDDIDYTVNALADEIEDYIVGLSQDIEGGLNYLSKMCLSIFKNQLQFERDKDGRCTVTYVGQSREQDTDDPRPEFFHDDLGTGECAEQIFLTTLMKKVIRVLAKVESSRTQNIHQREGEAEEELRRQKASHKGAENEERKQLLILIKEAQQQEQEVDRKRLEWEYKKKEEEMSQNALNRKIAEHQQELRIEKDLSVRQEAIGLRVENTSKMANLFCETSNIQNTLARVVKHFRDRLVLPDYLEEQEQSEWVQMLKEASHH